ncbi:MAG: exosome complex RNA-binding protein Csl4 [Nitrososphaerales archaeon]
MEQKKIVLPGEELGVIEEASPGTLTHTSRGSIRASRVGKPVYAKEDRKFAVIPAKNNFLPVPGDVVIGRIEVVQSNSMTMSLDFINGKKSQKRLSGIIQIPREQAQRSRQKKTHCKLGDLVRAGVTSTTNALTQMTIQKNEFGVIHASCSICGDRTVRLESNLKCPSCGNVEERTLAEDYGVKINS